MNLEHLRAFVWLRYRLLVNQLMKGGIGNRVLLILIGATCAMAGVALFVAFFLIGALGLSKLSPTMLMFIWDGLVVTFLFLWSIGVLSELQRSEALSLEKFLHLPVSPAGVFGLNYLSSWFSVNLMLFLSLTIGFCLGLAWARGPALLLVLPLLLSFMVMVTALTYQLQGWLASLMVDKRRRRTVIMAATLGFVLICQLPNLINFFRPWEGMIDDSNVRAANEQIELRRARDAREISEEVFLDKLRKVQKDQLNLANESKGKLLAQVEEYGTLFNIALPIGWLPLGVKGACTGDVGPAFFGTLGYGVIGLVSLLRAYRTTLRLYTGAYTAGQTQTAVSAPSAKPSDAPTHTLLDRRVPWVSEQASIIALAGLRSISRAPEAKMLLITPLMLAIVVGGMYFRVPGDVPEYVRPMIAFGGISFLLITLTQWVGNQFGFDRGGFRIFVLSPAPRRDILLGKNLAVAPIAVGLGVAAIAVVQLLFPMRIDHVLALFAQLVTMFLLFCTLANFLSIYAPMAIASGTMKPANTKMVPVMLNMLFMGAYSLAVGPTLLPFGIEAGLDALGWVEGIPIALPLALVECALAAAIYRVALTWQGTLLQAREQAILEIVTTKAE